MPLTLSQNQSPYYLKHRSYSKAGFQISRKPSVQPSFAGFSNNELAQLAQTNPGTTSKKQNEQLQQLRNIFSRYIFRGSISSQDKNMALRTIVLKQKDNGLSSIKFLLDQGADPGWQTSNDNISDTAFDFAKSSPRLLRALNENKTQASFKERILKKKIYPSIQFQQQSIGNCYFLAAIDSALNSNQWHSLLDRIQIFKLNKGQCDDKLYRIKFTHGVSYQPVTVRSSEIGKARGEYLPVNGPKYLQMMELAFARLIQRKRNIEEGNAEDNGETFEIVGGGNPRDALMDMFGGEGFQYKLSGIKASDVPTRLKELQHNIALDEQNSYLVCISTFNKKHDHDQPIPFRNGFQTVTLPLNHAYSVRSINSSNNTITIVDPHHSTQKVYTLPLEKCSELFDFVFGIKVPKDE
jgi:hypothetical protein